MAEANIELQARPLPEMILSYYDYDKKKWGVVTFYILRVMYVLHNNILP